MILYLNELSVPVDITDISALSLAKTLIKTLIRINKIETSSVIASNDLNSISLSQSRNLTFGLLFSGDDYRDEWSRLRSFFDRAPFNSLENGDYEYRYNNSVALGLGFAHINQTLAVSLATESWLEHRLNLTLLKTNLQLNRLEQANVAVGNIANEKNIEHWKDWILGDLPALAGFPLATRTKPKTPTNWGLRNRWILPTGEILEWDYLHGEIEKYNSRGIHLGAFDPDTGLAIANKGAVPSRRIEP